MYGGETAAEWLVHSNSNEIIQSDIDLQQLLAATDTSTLHLVF